MQTLQVNYQSVFEALPGMHLLLHTDSPRFTIASISSDYSSISRISKEEATGKSIFDIRLDANLNWDESLAESLHIVLRTQSEHSFYFPSGHNGTSGKYQIINQPVTTNEGGSTEVSFIIHKVTLAADERSEIVKIVEGNRRDSSIGLMIEQSPVAMAIVRGENFVIEEANDKMLELWGKSKSIKGLPILKAIPEIATQPFPKLMRQVFVEGKEYSGTETKAYLNKNGKVEEMYFNFVYAPLRDSDGNVSAIMMIASDVSVLVNARKELEESEKRYRDLISNATVATAVYIGEDMVIRLANDAMLRLWGKDRSVIGKPLREAVPELEGQPFIGLLKQVYQTGKTYHSKEDKAHLKANGRLQTFYFNFTYKALYDTGGNIYGVLNMAVDVSDIVRTKMAIFEAEERWRLALESAELGTWDYFPESRLFICSARTKIMFGIPENIQPKFEMILQTVHPQDRERVAQSIRKSMRIEGGPSYRVEYSVIRMNDKKERWHRTTGQAFYKENGEAYRLTGTILDITDRKQIEVALEERVNERTAELIATNKELERSNHELEQYAYVASHDLQEPLRKILVYSDMLKHNLPSPAGGAYENRLEKVISSAQRMSHLIQDLLNFSKLLKTETTFQSVDLNAVIKNVIDDFELMIQETGAKIQVLSLPTIEASSQQMNQLFYNLISNALKFRREGVKPLIKIEARELKTDEVEKFGELNGALTYFDISVTDNGIGFDTKYGKQIFEIFKRLNTRTKFEGTGIGLAVCRKITLKHQGMIYTESHEEEGSVFHVILPEKQFV
jgi:PAS domain S-box-containing protein